MEDLNKKQLILLVILITFVISMSTSIITVSLLSESPSTVTQTVNRVVEKTIERVVTPGEEIERRTEIKEIVIKEDAILESAEKAILSIGVLKDQTDTSNKEISKTGVLLDTNLVFSLQEGTVLNENYIFELSENKYPLEFKSNIFNFYVFSVNTEDKKGISIFEDDLSLGQTMIYIDPRGERILTGIISQFNRNEEGLVLRAEVDMVIEESGGIFVDLSGRLVGLKVYGEEKTFIPIKVLMDDLERVQ